MACIPPFALHTYLKMQFQINFGKWESLYLSFLEPVFPLAEFCPIHVHVFFFRFNVSQTVQYSIAAQTRGSLEGRWHHISLLYQNQM